MFVVLTISWLLFCCIYIINIRLKSSITDVLLTEMCNLLILCIFNPMAKVHIPYSKTFWKISNSILMASLKNQRVFIILSIFGCVQNSINSFHYKLTKRSKYYEEITHLHCLFTFYIIHRSLPILNFNVVILPRRQTTRRSRVVDI